MDFKETLKKALKELGDDVSPEQGMQYLSALLQAAQALESAAAVTGEEAEDVEASRAGADPVKASTAETMVDGADGVTLADESAPGMPKPEDEGAAPLESKLAEMLMEAAGVADLDALVSMLEARKEELAAFLSGGAPPAGGDQVGLSKDVVEATKAIKAALSKKVADRDGEIKALRQRIDAMEFANLERRVDDAVAKGEILEVDKQRLMKLARKAPELIDEFISAGRAAPAVPAGQLIAPRPVAGAGEPNESDADPRLVEIYFNANRSDPRLTLAQAKQEAIKDAIAFKNRKPARA